MNLAQIRLTRPLVNLLSALLVTGAFAFVMFAALRSPLKDDIAWLLYVARRWLAGRELYVDVVEVNPPLIIWISAIPLTIARWLGVGQQYVAMPAFAGFALACAWWSACLLRPAGPLFALRMPVFAVVGTVLLIIPAAELGQREHLLVAAFLPYLILYARAFGADGDNRPGVAAYTAAGLLAALGCGLKPQYGLAFVVLETIALCRPGRSWRAALLDVHLAAPISAAVALAAYVAAVALLCPAYLHRAVPMALALYGATDVSFRSLLWASAPLLAAEVLAFIVWWRDRSRLPESALLMTGAVFAAVSSLIFFIDGKDWFYHRIPATVATVLVLILWMASTIRLRLLAPAAGPSTAWRRWRGPALAGLVIVLFGVSAGQRLSPEVLQAVEPHANTVERVEALIRLHHARTYVAFSEWLALGFPVVNNTGVLWASRFDSMWALKGELWRAHTDPAAAKEWPVARWVANDFLSGCPDIVVVDTRMDVNYVSVLSAAVPEFAQAWSRYKQIVAFDGLKVYKRAKGGCVAPWVAAQGSAAALGQAAGTRIR